MGVSLLCLALLVAASRLRNDWLAVVACFAVLGIGGSILDYSGRKQAARTPNSLFKPERLPQGDTKLKPFFIVVIVVGLFVDVSLTVKPNAHSSPLPYFVAAGFIFLVLPQVLAHYAVSNARKSK